MKWSWKSEAPSLLVLVAVGAHSGSTWPLAPRNSGMRPGQSTTSTTCALTISSGSEHNLYN